MKELIQKTFPSDKFKGIDFNLYKTGGFRFRTIYSSKPKELRPIIYDKEDCTITLEDELNSFIGYFKNKCEDILPFVTSHYTVDTPESLVLSLPEPQNPDLLSNCPFIINIVKDICLHVIKHYELQVKKFYVIKSYDDHFYLQYKGTCFFKMKPINLILAI